MFILFYSAIVLYFRLIIYIFFQIVHVSTLQNDCNPLFERVQERNEKRKKKKKKKKKLIV
jgi:hypothetical protein